MSGPQKQAQGEQKSALERKLGVGRSRHLWARIRVFSARGDGDPGREGSASKFGGRLGSVYRDVAGLSSTKHMFHCLDP